MSTTAKLFAASSVDELEDDFDNMSVSEKPVRCSDTCCIFHRKTDRAHYLQEDDNDLSEARLLYSWFSVDDGIIDTVICTICSMLTKN